MVDFLIENGADVNAKKYNEETPLHEAVRSGKFKRIVVNIRDNRSKLFHFSVQVIMKQLNFLLMAAQM